MEKVTLGSTGLQVSAVGFGGIPIQRLSFEEAEALINHTIDLGVNFIDTAAGYGDSQRKIGRVMQKRRSEVILATKSPARDRKGMREDIERALEEMRTDHIDLFQLHGVNNRQKWEDMEAGGLEALIDARDRGEIGHIGFSSHSLDMALALVGDPRLETVQFPFNLVTSEAAEKLIPKALEKEVGFIVMKPLCGGQYSEAELAFKFLNSYPRLVPIPGIEKVWEIEEIVKLVETRRELAGEEERRAREVAEKLGKHFCRRCGYCEPCPEGVPAALSMIFESMVARLPDDKLKSGPARKLSESAGNCIRCGECEEKCPYELPIMEKVKEAGEQAEEIMAC